MPIRRPNAALLVKISLASRYLNGNAPGQSDVTVKIEQALAGEVDGD
jgi:hypothetical protein